MKRFALLGWLAFVAMPGLLMAQADADFEANGEIAVEVQLAQDGLLTTQAAPVEHSKYWIGLSCESIDDALRSQLALESPGGLVIRQVVDEGPAKAAGMQVHDVITQVKIGDETSNPADIAALTKLVQQAETKPMEFTLLRGGKPLTIAVTPAERAALATAAATLVDGIDNVQQPQLELLFLKDGVFQYQPHMIEPNVMAYRMAGPVLALTRQQPANLPDDITVIIRKTGGQPAEIVVQQKDQGEWKLTQGELADQPDHVNKAVSNALAIVAQMTINGRIEDGKAMIKFEPRPHVNAPHSAARALWLSKAYEHLVQPQPVAPYYAAPAVPATPVPAEIPTLQQQLNQLQQQQEQLTKALNDLRQALEKTQPKD